MPLPPPAHCGVAFLLRLNVKVNVNYALRKSLLLKQKITVKESIIP